MKKILFLIFLIVLTISALFGYFFTKNYGKACEAYASEGIKSELSRRMFRSAVEMISAKGVKNEDISKATYRPDGSMAAIRIDSAKVNGIALETAEALAKALEVPESEFKIPLGNALGSKLFSGKGPGIKVRIIPVGSVSYELKSTLESGGINQTVHRISLRFAATIKCLAPFEESVQTITGEIIICETVIVGEVPEILFGNPSGAFE